MPSIRSKTMWSVILLSIFFCQSVAANPPRLTHRRQVTTNLAWETIPATFPATINDPIDGWMGDSCIISNLYGEAVIVTLRDDFPALGKVLFSQNIPDGGGFVKVIPLDTKALCVRTKEDPTEVCIEVILMWPHKIPTVSAWGFAAMLLLLLVGAKVCFNRRRVTDPA